MINSSKQSTVSKLFQPRIFGNPEINDDIEPFDLHRITSDIEKLICDDENFVNSFEENFDEFQDETEVTEMTKSLNAENANSNNNSIIVNGNIWQNQNEKGDDSFILAEKFENLKNTSIQRKNRIASEDCYRLTNQMLFDNEKRNFCNLTQAKFFEKESVPRASNMNNANYHYYDQHDFFNNEEPFLNFGGKIYTSKFQPEKQLMSSPQSISTSPSETGLSAKSGDSQMNLMNLQGRTPSTAGNSSVSQNVFDRQTIKKLAKKKLNFEEKLANYDEERSSQYDFYTGNTNFLGKTNSENDNANSLFNSRNYACKTNKFDHNSQIDEFNLETISEDGEGFACDSNAKFNNNYNNNNAPNYNIYNYGNLNYNNNHIDNVETNQNFNKINRANANINFNPSDYYNYNYCKYFIDESSKKNLIKTDNINYGNTWYNSNNNNNNFNICNMNNKASYQKKSQEVNYINSKLSYKERKKEIKSNKKGSNADDENNKIILENIIKRKDKRTTIMIKNIPNKYTLKSLVEDLNVELKGKYDLLYLPLDYVNNCNLGFAFINFVDSFHIILFEALFCGKKWNRFNSEKICELAYAKIQGKNDLIAHFEKGTVLNFESKDKKPLILNTPSPLPKIVLPSTVLDMFVKYHPWSNLEVSEERFLINSFNGF